MKGDAGFPCVRPALRGVNRPHTRNAAAQGEGTAAGPGRRAVGRGRCGARGAAGPGPGTARCGTKVPARAVMWVRRCAGGSTRSASPYRPGCAVRPRTRGNSSPFPAVSGPVKGAFPEPGAVALPREAPAAKDACLAHAEQPADSGRLCSFAAHDRDLLHRIDHLGEKGRADALRECETLLGLGPDRLDAMARHGHPAREYVVLGTEWWLHVCDRLAGDPRRALQALVDAAS